MAPPQSHSCLVRTGTHKQCYWPRPLVKQHQLLLAGEHSTGGGHLILPTPYLSAGSGRRAMSARLPPRIAETMPRQAHGEGVSEKEPRIDIVH